MAYPDNPVRVILPNAAGGSGDIIFRSIQPGLEKRLGQSMVLDFRTGAGGQIGVREVVKSAPDGYTLLLGPTNNFVIDQFLYKDLGYDPQQALAPVTIIADTPYMLVVNDNLPARTYAELAAYARTNRGKLNYASPGPATVPHLSGFMLSEAMGAGMVHIAFRGNAPAVVALLANEIQMIVHSYGSIAPLFKSGKLRALAVGASERLRVMPGVPTSAEAGGLGGLNCFREPHSDLRDESFGARNPFDPDDRAFRSEVIGAKVHTDASGEIDALRAVHFPDVSIGGAKRDRPHTGLGGNDKSAQSITFDACSFHLSMCGG